MVEQGNTEGQEQGSKAYHAESVDAVLDYLESSADRGLSHDEARQRRERHGPNELPEDKRAGLVRIFLRQFTDPLIYILLIAAGVSLAIGSVANAAFITAVLLLNAIVGCYQEYQSESSAQALQSVVRMCPRVLRDGQRDKVDATDLVPGDIVLLETGDTVPADLRLIESTNLQSDESLITGESTPVDKDAEAELDDDTPLAERQTLLHSGSAVMAGRATGVVIRTGQETEIGQIAASLAKNESGTPPLVQKLKRLTHWIAIFTLVAVAGVALIQFVNGKSFVDIFTLAVALSVAAIPAGLPVAITVALSVASSRMAERNVIVRRLAAVEGLGSCTLIASDKTGTLTANKLTVQRVWLGPQRQTEIGGEARSLEGDVTADGETPDDETNEALRAFATGGALASEGELTIEQGELQEAEGDTTDLAFLILAAKLGIEQRSLAEEYPEKDRIPFEASKFFSATFNNHQDRLIAHVKGAPETIIDMCSMDDDTRQAIEHQQKAWADEGFRILAVAGGDVSEASEESLHDLTFLGLAALIDPIRDEVPEAIERCYIAGVGVRMVTGDHPDTAYAIGSGLKLADEREQVITGKSLSEASNEADERIGRARIFARVEPLQKTEIVESLQRDGHYVAVTGDGVNDAPALDRANIGIAMGASGTEVARSAGDLILTDDNFASVVPGIEWGRTAYDNVRKVVWLLLSTGAAEVLLFFLALGFGLPIPLTAVQLLWLNMVTNGIQDVALGFEKTEPGVLDRPPPSPDEPIFDRRMVENVLVSGLYIGMVAFGVYYYLYSVMGMEEGQARNLTLLLMVLFENIHLLSCRSERRSLFKVPLRNNPLLLLSIIGAHGIHIAAMYIPGLKDVLGISPVSWQTWAILLGIAATLLIVDESAKWLRSRRHDQYG
ncbi:P-type E1-E2 ATPase [Modicisalibacter xianhensis]|uniref:P-type E1-E2 ATPase n=1 Tax=Modicisalibacter xianhensis TaxID=442341 RepID=A0A4V6QAV2_9GAMM|nr:HAD-IC family P-type ATPase [Halomonas xianhensis]TDX31464.1 P-type E1-E2 ATPase [Halomonas xianhensis]